MMRRQIQKKIVSLLILFLLFSFTAGGVFLSDLFREIPVSALDCTAYPSQASDLGRGTSATWGENGSQMDIPTQPMP